MSFVLNHVVLFLNCILLYCLCCLCVICVWFMLAYFVFSFKCWYYYYYASVQWACSEYIKRETCACVCLLSGGAAGDLCEAAVSSMSQYNPAT